MGGAGVEAGWAGTVTMCCHLSSSDTQYKMTISMAVWPSEASEVSQGSGQALGHPASDGRQVWPEVCRLLGTSRPLPPRLLPPVSPKDCAGDMAVNGTDRPLPFWSLLSSCRDRRYTEIRSFPGAV